METQRTGPISHYYGDIIRAIFIVAGVIILIGFPAVTKGLGLPVVFVVIGLVVLGLAAGLTNPVQKNSLVLNVVVSVAGLIYFVFLSVRMQQISFHGFYFVLNQILAICFLLAVYFSIKSLRGFLLKR